MNNTDTLQFSLTRTDDWIKFAEQKSAFIAIYYSAIIGFAISNKECVADKLVLANNLRFYLLSINAILITIILCIGMYFLISSIFPRLKNQLTNESLFYFGSISQMKFVDYQKAQEEITSKEINRQIAEQIYTNSTIASKKMTGIQRSVKFLLIGCLSIVIFILL